jgi:hypothetical protein
MTEGRGHPERREGSQCNGVMLSIENKIWERFLSPFEMTTGGLRILSCHSGFVLSSRFLSSPVILILSRPVIPNGERDLNAMAVERQRKGKDTSSES